MGTKEFQNLEQVLLEINQLLFKFQKDDRKQVIKYYKNNYPDKVHNQAIRNKKTEYIGYPLLLQITNLLKQEEKFYPQSLSILLLLRCSYCLDDYDKIDCVSKICLRCPNQIVQIFNKAQVLYLNKELDQAQSVAMMGIKVCKQLKLPALNEIHSELCYLNGNILQYKQKWNSSSTNYINAVQKNQSNLTFRIAAVESCLVSQTYEDARKLIDSLAKDNPDSILFMAMSIAVYALQQKYDFALTKFREMKKIVQSDRSNETKIANYYLCVGIYHFKVMEFEQSFRHLSIAESTNKTNLFVLKWLGHCCYLLQKYKLSLRYYLQVGKLLKNHEQQLQNSMRIGIIYLAMVRNDYEYYYNVRQIIKRVQLSSRCKKLGFQSYLLLLQLYSALNQPYKMIDLAHKYPEVWPILSLQDSRANIYFAKQCKRLLLFRSSKQLFHQVIDYVCSIDDDEHVVERFQQMCSLIRQSFLNKDPYKIAIVKQKANELITYMGRISQNAAKIMRMQLKEQTKFDFQLTFGIK